KSILFTNNYTNKYSVGKLINKDGQHFYWMCENNICEQFGIPIIGLIPNEYHVNTMTYDKNNLPDSCNMCNDPLIFYENGRYNKKERGHSDLCKKLYYDELQDKQ